MRNWAYGWAPIVFGAIFTGMVAAEDESHHESTQADQTASEPVQSTPGEVFDPDQSLEPEVRIIDQGAQRIEEYRVNGLLYMIKVTPRHGFSYYLMDADGDGVLETRRNDLDPDFLVPRWTIFTWR